MLRCCSKEKEKETYGENLQLPSSVVLKVFAGNVPKFT